MSTNNLIIILAVAAEEKVAEDEPAAEYELIENDEGYYFYFHCSAQVLISRKK